MYHEAECRRRNAAAQPSGIHGYAPARSRRPGRGLPRTDTQSQRRTESDNRICRSEPATQFRRRRRVCGTSRNPRLSGKHRTRAPQQGADTRIGSRHQSRFGCSGRFHHGHLRLRRTRECRHGRPACQSRREQGRPRRANDYLSVHPWHL